MASSHCRSRFCRSEVQLPEVVRRFVQHDLRGLHLRHLVLELFLLRRDRLGHALDVQVELLDPHVVRPHVLLQREVVVLLLPGGERPLLQLLLVPVHQQLELVELLRAAVHVLLEAVELLLEILLLPAMLRDLLLDAPAFPLAELLKVRLGLVLALLGVHAGLSVSQILLHVREVLVHHPDAVRRLLNRQVDALQLALLRFDQLVELLVLLVGEGREKVRVPHVLLVPEPEQVLRQARVALEAPL